MQGDAADQLDVVVDHVPDDFVAARHPVVAVNGLVAFDIHKVVVHRQVAVELRRGDGDGRILLETASGGLHDGKSLGEDFVKAFLYCIVLVLNEFVRLGGEFFLLGNGDVPGQFFTDGLHAVFEGLFNGGNLLLQCLAAGAEFVVGKPVYVRVNFQYLVQDRLDGLHVPVGLGTGNGFQYICNCHNLCISIWC